MPSGPVKVRPRYRDYEKVDSPQQSPQQSSQQSSQQLPQQLPQQLSHQSPQQSPRQSPNRASEDKEVTSGCLSSCLRLNRPISTQTPLQTPVENNRAKEELPFSIERVRSIVKTVPGEDITYQMYREEMRMNTLVSCLGVVISAAALVMSVSKNKTVNNIIICISAAAILLISLTLLDQMGRYGWGRHDLPGGSVLVSILVILGMYFFSDSTPA